ncbi:hypothetical protein P154DRAFT_321330 [Amniculicola lignicola CBS 123094]|uniref:Uncharacterized protein n=1 Tax=Amniculicola lignicola CBS 123094 TaxID=1392246 RepID=A0A6A5W8C5_9PLEO|nr:hypothetical protein P154DRAFT_321330 [Amniculicola lignicola CBS 123094]
MAQPPTRGSPGRPLVPKPPVYGDASDTGQFFGGSYPAQYPDTVVFSSIQEPFLTSPQADPWQDKPVVKAESLGTVPLNDMSRQTPPSTSPYNFVNFNQPQVPMQPPTPSSGYAPGSSPYLRNLPPSTWMPQDPLVADFHQDLVGYPMGYRPPQADSMAHEVAPNNTIHLHTHDHTHEYTHHLHYDSLPFSPNVAELPAQHVQQGPPHGYQHPTPTMPPPVSPKQIPTRAQMRQNPWTQEPALRQMAINVSNNLLSRPRAASEQGGALQPQLNPAGQLEDLILHTDLLSALLRCYSRSQDQEGLREDIETVAWTHRQRTDEWIIAIAIERGNMSRAAEKKEQPQVGQQGVPPQTLKRSPEPFVKHEIKSDEAPFGHFVHGGKPEEAPQIQQAKRRRGRPRKIPVPVPALGEQETKKPRRLLAMKAPKKSIEEEKGVGSGMAGEHNGRNGQDKDKALGPVQSLQQDGGPAPDESASL